MKIRSAALAWRPEVSRSRPGTRMKVPYTLYIAQDQDQDQDKEKSRSRLVLILVSEQPENLLLEVLTKELSMRHKKGAFVK